MNRRNSRQIWRAWIGTRCSVSPSLKPRAAVGARDISTPGLILSSPVKIGKLGKDSCLFFVAKAVNLPLPLFGKEGVLILASPFLKEGSRGILSPDRGEFGPGRSAIFQPLSLMSQSINAPTASGSDCSIATLES